MSRELESALKHWEGHWLAPMPPKELSYRDEPEKTIYRAVCLLADFDAIWRRYYDAADDNNTTTKEQLWEVVYGEKKEEE